jgi:hypothetical protein
VLSAKLGDAPGPLADGDVLAIYEPCPNDYMIIRCAILTCLEPELHQCFEHHLGAFDIIAELKTMFHTQACAERYEISENLFMFTTEEGRSVNEHAIKMIGYT